MKGKTEKHIFSELDFVEFSCMNERTSESQGQTPGNIKGQSAW